VPRYEALGVRRRGHGRYLIFYRVDPNAVVIVHVLHGAQDYEEILFPT
jgi:toxin ParE1/3/4